MDPERTPHNRPPAPANREPKRPKRPIEDGGTGSSRLDPLSDDPHSPSPCAARHRRWLKRQGREAEIDNYAVVSPLPPLPSLPFTGESRRQKRQEPKDKASELRRRLAAFRSSPAAPTWREVEAQVWDSPALPTPRKSRRQERRETKTKAHGVVGVSSSRSAGIPREPEDQGRGFPSAFRSLHSSTIRREPGDQRRHFPPAVLPPPSTAMRRAAEDLRALDLWPAPSPPRPPKTPRPRKRRKAEDFSRPVPSPAASSPRRDIREFLERERQRRDETAESLIGALRAALASHAREHGR